MTKIALIQFNGYIEREKNLEKMLRYTEESVSNGAQIICYHELAPDFYFCSEQDRRHFDLAEPIPGPTTELIGKIAGKHRIVVILPLFEKESNGEYYNSAAVIGWDGKPMGKYRKTHIPLLRNPGGIDVYEKFYFRPGNLGFPVFDTPFGVRIGIIICYDRHFPEAGRMIGLGGADVLFIPAASAAVTCNLWQVELQFHAMSNVMFVAGVNRVGKDKGLAPEKARNHFGSSMIVNHRGEIMSQGSAESDEIIYADLDLAPMYEFRNHCGYYRDRRPNVYSRLSVDG